MTLREHEHRQRQRQQSDPMRDRDVANRVMSFLDWCCLNDISPATGRRILKSGDGPTVTQLSPRRIGITLANNAAWQAARAR